MAEAEEAPTGSMAGDEVAPTRYMARVEAAAIPTRSTSEGEEAATGSMAGGELAAAASMLEEGKVRRGWWSWLRRYLRQRARVSRRDPFSLSGGSNLWVHCRVHPPRAEITVVDDGDGLGTPRDDSHGLKIMKERADRIGADLAVHSPALDGRGTRVTIRID